MVAAISPPVSRMRIISPVAYGASPSVSTALMAVRPEGNAPFATVTSPRRSTYFRQVQPSNAFSAMSSAPVPHLETEMRDLFFAKASSATVSTLPVRISLDMLDPMKHDSGTSFMSTITLVYANCLPK